MNNQDLFETPLKSRYASEEMLKLFSAQTKYKTWRILWTCLAKAEQTMGLAISDHQIEELKTYLDCIDYERVKHYEDILQHDVMAHLHAYADLCPSAKPILHLGATSAYITDNADLLLIKKAFSLIKAKLETLIKKIAIFANNYKSLACLAYTHLQPALPTTVGKRACLWLQDFQMDLEELEHRKEKLKFLGVKGATGTQSSFLTLFKGDSEKVNELECIIAKELGFSAIFKVAGQTYTRKQDVQVLGVLSGIAVSAHKTATDIRLLAHLKEIEEPFQTSQVGSSAMPHKRNPILSERICSLSRFVISLLENPHYTAATQWLERTLDDSANRRIVIPEAFLATDAVLNLLIQCFSNLAVYPKMIEKNLNAELPFLLTEEILMEAAKKGKDRQELHEALRKQSKQASELLKAGKETNPLFELISKDPIFQLSLEELQALCNVQKLTGRAEQQVTDFLKPYLE